MRAPFVVEPVVVSSRVGPLTLGVVDADVAGVADAISALLHRSIDDARETVGGHLPLWLVDDIKQNYISPTKIKTLWAGHGHRFVVLLHDEIVGTVHIGKRHDVILTVDRNTNNVEEARFPGFKPPRHHHVVNISVRHELRRAGVGSAMINGIVTHFARRGVDDDDRAVLFDGDGLWVRADPPWHASLLGLGFVHDPSMDLFLDESVARTAGLPHPAFNARYACGCVHAQPAFPALLPARAARMQRDKLQYLSLTRAFAPAASTSTSSQPQAPSMSSMSGEGRLGEGSVAARDAGGPHPQPLSINGEGLVGARDAGGASSSWTSAPAVLAAASRDHGGVFVRMPTRVARPTTVDALVDVVRDAHDAARAIVVRGRGFSVDGAALGDSVVDVSALDHVVVDGDRVVVGGGAAWSQVLAATRPLGRAPPVLTGFLPASVGGTLAVGGYSKGSHARGLVVDHVVGLVVVTGDGRRVSCSRAQAGWLFAAVLGGAGRFGVIAEATISLAPTPRRVRPTRVPLEHSRASYDVLAAATDVENIAHVTAYLTADGVTAVLTVIDDSDSADSADFFAYADPPRALTGPPQLWAHAFVPHAALDVVVDAARAVLDVDAGDSLQVIPIRRPAPARLGLLRWPAHDVVHGVSIVRELRDRDPARLRAEARAVVDVAVAAGGTRGLAGDAPVGEAAWRAHLGDDVDAVLRLKAIADPRGVLPPLW